MKTCHEIRKSQLDALAKEAGGVRRLAEMIGRTDVQIRQWINASKDSRTGKPRGISDDAAREIERLTGKEAGWLDNDPDRTGPKDWSRLNETQQAAVEGYISGLLAQASVTPPAPADVIEEINVPAPKQTQRPNRPKNAA